VQRIDAADLARLATVECSPEHKVAWLIGAAVDGHLELEETDRAVTLVRLPRHEGATKYLLDVAFAGRDRLTLDGYDPSFASAWQQVGSELAGWQENSVLWDPAGDRRRVLARSLGALAALVGLVVTALGASLASRQGPGWLALVAARYSRLAPTMFSDTSRTSTKPSSGGSDGGGFGGGGSGVGGGGGSW
jgi:hypothetical protein